MNRIAKIIEKKGIAELRPSEALLDQLGVKINTWNQWVANKRDPEIAQLHAIAAFLDCNVCELIQEPELAKA